MAPVEVVYIPAGNNALQALIPFIEGMTVAKALEQSGFLDRFPELVNGPVGIFSRAVSRDVLVQPGDRVELYRPLRLDPMETRRQRARRKV
ncbi:MAG TPA: RnfH family protein [Legionella sp.]|nr:RnfH family protein [Legionella sp.]